ncbi:hypothetical protein H8N03_20975 [Ramlibacter sp. USB13]|uniref:Uncharacterized protein n=1 Tax=Ramlibacter cellulosilyticus TaxID=2764187 RepID=A0A923MWI7_9BURK|nr:hypothetical protein [Ramlibacter cellulosilyticus]MBC5785434.1 hypothetical protein [Ramlibacter cellulosilyticus]
MFGIPMYVWFFLFAAIAAVAARVLAGPVGDDAGSFPGWILYAVAAGCVVIALALIALGH